MRLILQIRARLAQLASKNWIYKPLFIVIGFVSLLWFLFRVVPKPSRASYPCMQTAFPIASSFVLWFIGSVGSIALFKKIPVAFKNRSYLKVAAFSFVGVALLLLATTFNNDSLSFANTLAPKVVADPVKKDYGNTIDQLKVKVGVVKSDKALVTDIKYPEILSMVREAVRLSGGFGNLITDGKTVMLKPNIVSDFANRSIEANGATTDYRVVQAVVELVRELNPHGKIIIAEGSAGTTKTFMTRLKYMDITGVNSIMGLEECSGKYRDYASDSLVAVNLPDALSRYPDDLKPNKTRAIYYNKRYYQADVLISIPVLKNHLQAGITGGVKNVAIGCTPANIYADNTYGSPFQRIMIDHAQENLNKWIHDYYVGRPVDFVVMDALQGGSSGPGVGNNDLAKIKSNQHNMRLIIAGRDAVATDAVEGLIMGHDPQLAPYLVYIHNSGFGTVDPALIDVVGVKVNTVRKFFGFDNKNVVVPTPFTKFASTDYQITGSIKNNILTMSVSNPIDLARMTVKVDNQFVNKYVVGGFDNISLSLAGITVTQGKIDVLFEDRYLNPLNKQFTAPIQTAVPKTTSGQAVSIYPNPTSKILNIQFANSTTNREVKVFDTNGKLLYYNNAGNSVITVDVQSLHAKGTIVVQVKSNGETHNHKILVQ